MPKASKARFNKARITEQLDAWKKAALDLEKMWKRAFRSIRSYIPKHEASLTNAETVRGPKYDFSWFFPKWREFGFFNHRKTIFFVNLGFLVAWESFGSAVLRNRLSIFAFFGHAPSGHGAVLAAFQHPTQPSHWSEFDAESGSRDQKPSKLTVREPKPHFSSLFSAKKNQ